MKKKMTKKEGRAYLKRWKEVRRVLDKELQQTTPQRRIQELFYLFSARTLFPSNPIKQKEEIGSRKRWAQLYRLLEHG